MTHTTHRHRQVLLLATVLAAVLAGAVLLAGAASAQEASNPLDNETTTDGPTEVTEQLGDLVVHSYSYNAGTETMSIEATWQGEVPETVTLTEMIELDSAGATEITFKTVRLLPDSATEIEVGAKQRSGGTAAVMLTTPQSVDNNNALVLQAGDGGGSSSVPFNAATGLTVLAAAGGALGTFWITKRQREDTDDEWSERLA